MNEHRLTDARIAAALRAHLPAEATPGMTARVMDAVTETRQERSLPWSLPLFEGREGSISHRRQVLLAAALLLAIALAGVAAAGALRYLQQQSTPPIEMDLTPAEVESICAAQPGACLPMEAVLRSFARGQHDRGTMLPTTSTGATNGWIAYSTDPAVVIEHHADPYDPNVTVTNGSDLYLVRPGRDPMRIADRAGGMTWNACPAFSPDGSRLAFGVTRGSERAMVVVEVDASGIVGEPIRIAVPARPSIAVPGSTSIACPRWSSDGRRLGYLEGSSVMMYALEGSPTAGADGDPSAADFAPRVPETTDGDIVELEREMRRVTRIPSPSGDRTVQLDVDGDCQLVLATPDGSSARVLRLGGGVGERHVDPLTRCPYAIAGWSPDGRQVLIMQDVGRHQFTMVAVSVEPPYLVTTVVSHVPTNAGDWDLWAGYGDVDWQPVLD